MEKNNVKITKKTRRNHVELMEVVEEDERDHKIADNKFTPFERSKVWELLQLPITPAR